LLFDDSIIVQVELHFNDILSLSNVFNQVTDCIQAKVISHTAKSQEPNSVVLFTVFIFVQLTKVACLASNPVFKRLTVGYLVVLVSIVVFSLFVVTS